MQAELGILGTHNSIQIELKADCLAGAYSAYAATQSENVMLEFGDIDEAATSLFLINNIKGYANKPSLTKKMMLFKLKIANK